MKQVDWDDSSLTLRNVLQNTQTLQLFTMSIKIKSIYKCYSKCQGGKLGRRDLGVLIKKGGGSQALKVML